MTRIVWTAKRAFLCQSETPETLHQCTNVNLPCLKSLPVRYNSFGRVRIPLYSAPKALHFISTQ
jgi:hypothetical protein